MLMEEIIQFHQEKEKLKAFESVIAFPQISKSLC